MKQLPKTPDTLLLRTDFSNQAIWEEVCKIVRTPIDDFEAQVTLVEDRAYENASVEALVDLNDVGHEFIFIIDKMTITHPEHPLLCVDLWGEPGNTLRVIPTEVGSIENNLSISNMDFEDFAENVDEDGIYRGFD